MDPDSSLLRVVVSDGRGRRVADGGLARWLAAVAPRAARGELGVALVSDARMRTLNKKYRRKDYATDVLSFESDTLGDLVIATGVARRQAREAGHSYQTELRVLALHGLLHLLGYDHEDPDDNGRMRRMESRLRRKGGLKAGLIGREIAPAAAASSESASRAAPASGGRAPRAGRKAPAAAASSESASRAAAASGGGAPRASKK